MRVRAEQNEARVQVCGDPRRHAVAEGLGLLAAFLPPSYLRQVRACATGQSWATRCQSGLLPPVRTSVWRSCRLCSWALPTRLRGLPSCVCEPWVPSQRPLSGLSVCLCRVGLPLGIGGVGTWSPSWHVPVSVVLGPTLQKDNLWGGGPPPVRLSQPGPLVTAVLASRRGFHQGL